MKPLDTVKLKQYLVWGALVGLMALGLFIRVRGLSEYHYSPDEAMDLWISGRPSLAALWGLGRLEPHPPLRCVVQHYMLAVSRDPLFLRSFSLVPSVLLIAVFFGLGRKALGTAAGLTMAFLAAFGYGGVLIAQVMRAYPLAVLGQSAALLFYISYLDDRRARHLYGFAAAIVLALSTTYIQFIVILAVYAVGLGHLAVHRRPAAEYRNLFLSAIPAAGALVLFYFIHLRHLFATPRFDNPIEGWNAPFFFSDLGGLFFNLYDLFGYLFLPPVAAPAVVLTVVGLAVLWRKSRRELLLIFILVLLINLALTAAGKFSFGGVRHSFHFFPFIALAVGAAVQGGYDFARARVSPRRSGAAAIAGFLVFILAALALTGYYRESDYLRRYGPKSWMELPVKNREYEDGMAQLAARAEPGDLIFASYQTVLYLEQETGRFWTPVSEDLGRFRYQGRDWYFALQQGRAGEWDITPPEILRPLLRDLTVIARVPPERSVWVVNFGWNGKIGWMTSDPFWSERVKGIFEKPGASVYRLPVGLLLTP